MNEHWNDTLSAEDVFATSRETFSFPPTEWSRRLAPPPRPIPFLMRCSFLLGQGMGFMSWFLFFFSTLLIFWLLWSWGNYRDFLPNSAMRWETLPTQGIVTENRNSNLTVDGVPIQEHTFLWTSPEGEEALGKCYSQVCFSKGTPVSVQRSGNHYRIVGTTQGALGGGLWKLLLIMVFPVIGMLLIWLDFRKGCKILRLLRYGETASANVTQSKTTGSVYNGQPEWQVFYTFQAPGGIMETSVKTFHPVSNEDTASQTLLYNPEKLQETIVLDEYLTETLTLSESGDFQLCGRCVTTLWWVLGMAIVWGMGLWWVMMAGR